MSNPSPLPDPIGEIQAKYGEPWRAPYMGGIVLHREQMDRAIACVNALAGIADPAAHLSTLAATVERLEAERDAMEKRLAERYLRGGPNEQATIAELCDECLDRSGAMLGRIRAALAARTGRAET